MELHLPHLSPRASRFTSRIHVSLIVAVVSIIATAWAGWMISKLWIDGSISDAVISSRLLKLSTADVTALRTTTDAYHHPAALPTLKSDPLRSSSTPTP